MKNNRLLKKSFTLFALLFSISAFAQSFTVVNKTAKIFDEPNVKGYLTLNTKNEEINLIPGMAFKVLENKNGWFLVEYSPGLKGYLSQQFTTTSLSSPKEGTYPIENKQGLRLKCMKINNEWIAEVEGKKYPGKNFDNTLIFFNEDNIPAFSLVNIGGKTIVVDYDNAATNFF